MKSSVGEDEKLGPQKIREEYQGEAERVTLQKIRGEVKEELRAEVVASYRKGLMAKLEQKWIADKKAAMPEGGRRPAL